MIWPGVYENSTFFIVNSPSFNFPQDNNFKKIIPTETQDDSIFLEFDLVHGLNTFVANSTGFWDSQTLQVIDCSNPFDFKKQDSEYYDYVYPLKVQQNRAKIFDLTNHDFLGKSELTLIQRYDGSPACVMEQTVSKLIERGWGEPVPIPEPDTGEFRYGEQECNYVDENEEPRFCVVSGWTKPVSELDCEKICAPPGTKE